MRSAGGCPLQAETLLGVLDVGSRRLRHFSDADIELLRLAADRIARAIERGRVLELERAARERSEFLERTSAVLTRSLEIPDIMRRVVQAAVPRLGDWCQLAVFTDEQSNIPRIEVAHVDPDKLMWARELRDRFPYDPDSLTGIPAAVRTGTTQYYPEISDELITLVVSDPELRDVLLELHVRSMISVPLKGRTGILGALQLVHAESERRYTPADVQLAEAVAAHIAIALENARLYEREREIAGTLQQSLLPPHLPEIPGIELAHRYWTASDTALVGGDFFDVISVGPDSWGVLVGDVSGKGINAAALTGVARQTARAAARHGVGPSEVLAWLDDAVKDQSDQFGGQYCTAVYGLLERGMPEAGPGGVSGSCSAAIRGRCTSRPARRPGSWAARQRARAARPPIFHETELGSRPATRCCCTPTASPMSPGRRRSTTPACSRSSPKRCANLLRPPSPRSTRRSRPGTRVSPVVTTPRSSRCTTRPRPSGAPAFARSSFPRSSRARAEARRFVRDTLEPLGVPTATIDDAELVATELVTNSVMHARSDVTLSVECANRRFAAGRRSPRRARSCATSPPTRRPVADCSSSSSSRRTGVSMHATARRSGSSSNLTGLTRLRCRSSRRSRSS